MQKEPDDLVISDPQAEGLWGQLAAERRDGKVLTFASPEETLAYLSEEG